METDRTEDKAMGRRDALKLGLLTVACLSCNRYEAKSGSTPASVDKYTKEALFYSVENGRLFCDLCPAGCIVGEGKTGDCRTRKNIDGKLYTVAYGNPCSVSVDPIEKKPLYHFLPASTAFSFSTAGCNFQCLNCQNWEISQAKPSDVRYYDMMPEKAIELCGKYNSKSIAYTYTEPTVFYEYMYDTAVLARDRSIKNLMITNGYISRKPLKQLTGVLDAANVDLKSFDDAIYQKLNKGNLQPILDTLKTMQENGVWLEITNLVIPEWTDDMKMIEKMCKWLVANNFDSQPLHFSRFFPAYKLDKTPATPKQALVNAQKIALDTGMKYVYIGNLNETEGEKTVCPKCKTVLIDRTGFGVNSNRIKKSVCPDCGEKIDGVWE